MGQNNSGVSQVRPNVTPIDQRGVPRAPVPYFINIEPAAAVAAAATVTVTYTLGPRDFVWTHLGWTTQAVGFPAAGVDFKLNIRDIGLSTMFAPFRFLLRAVTGNNPATSDNPAFQLPQKSDGTDPWRFERSTSIEVQFENIGVHLCLPYIVLVGYLD